MLVRRYSPLDQFRNIRRSFDFMNEIMNSLEQNQSDALAVDFNPSVNTREGEFAYHIEVDLPGIKKEDVEINVDDNILTIAGKRELKNENKEENYYKIESSYGAFSRSFTLPEKVDIENISATSVDGVLEVVIPKLKVVENSSKKIEIK